jgi:hypothetical protein
VVRSTSSRERSPTTAARSQRWTGERTCTNQQYLVSDRLQSVETSTTSGGSGRFAVTLTHYRYSLFGHCVIYKARVDGAVSFIYQA